MAVHGNEFGGFGKVVSPNAGHLLLVQGLSYSGFCIRDLFFTGGAVEERRMNVAEPLNLV